MKQLSEDRTAFAACVWQDCLLSMQKLDSKSAKGCNMQVLSSLKQGTPAMSSSRSMPDLSMERDAPPREAYTMPHTVMPARVPAMKGGTFRGVMPSK